MRIKAGLRCWVHCLSRTCNHKEMVFKHELTRAKRYRCSRCGGPVEMSKEAADRVATANDARDRAIARNDVDPTAAVT